MTFYEGLSLLTAVVALLLSGAALWISIPLQRLQRQQMEEANLRKKQADVRLKLIELPTGRPCFVIENVGQGAAYHVTMDLTPPQDKKSPLANDYKVKIPIAMLQTGDRVELAARISGDTGSVFDAKWSWRTEDGTTEERANRITLLRGAG